MSSDRLSGNDWGDEGIEMTQDNTPSRDKKVYPGSDTVSHARTTGSRKSRRRAMILRIQQYCFTILSRNAWRYLILATPWYVY